MVLGNILAAIFLRYFDRISILFIIFLIVGGIATISFLLLRPPPEKERPKSQLSNLIFETVLLLKEPELLLLIPIISFSGISQSFYFGTIPPRMGTKLIGFVLACLGGGEIIAGFGFGKISPYIGRKTVIALSYLSCMGGLVAVYFANTNSRVYLYYIGMTAFGISDAGTQTQLYAILGSLLPTRTESAFAFFKLIQATTTATAFFYSPYVSFEILIFIMVGVSSLGVVCVYFSSRKFIDLK